MAASVSGAKTVNNDVTPCFKAAALTTLMDIAPENLTVAQLRNLSDAADSVPGGKDPTRTLGSLFL